MIPVSFVDSRLLLTSLLLVAALLLGAFIIAAVRRWQQMGSRGLTANDQLAQYRRLHARGEIDDDEFRRLRELLSGQIRQESGLSASKPPPDEGIKGP